MIRHFGNIRFDYKPTQQPARMPRERSFSFRWIWFAAGLAVPAAVLAFALGRPALESPVATPQPGPDLEIAEVGSALESAVLTTTNFGSNLGTENENGAFAPDLQPLLAHEEPIVEEEPEDLLASLQLTVASGDTLEQLFRRHDLSIPDLFSIVNTPNVGNSLSLLRPGDVITILHEEGRVQQLERELDEVRVLHVERNGNGYVAQIDEREITRHVATSHAVVQSSLFNAGRAAGLSDTVTMNMAALFQWDIDFVLDIRQGDEFTVVYEERWRDGELLGYGPILAAEFVNRGRSHRVVRFEIDGRADYYTPDGSSIRAAFIRAPVDFTRISSSFNPNRLHPIYNITRPHNGVDYAAPTGTPIYAAGDGRVITRSFQNGYGNTVIIEHGGNITTLYAHMSSFHANVQVGTRVQQGQVIGYVGATGDATGPHLHYEFRINGVHHDPVTVELPRAEPVPGPHRARFDAEVEDLLAELAAGREQLLLALAQQTFHGD